MSQSPSVPEALAGLVVRALSADGQPPFSDQSLVELARGERELVERVQGSAVVGVAIVGDDEFELVVDPDARGRGAGTALLETVLGGYPAAESAWAHGDHPASRALAARFGFEPVRTLLQLRVGLDTPPPAALDQRGTPPPAALDQRAFRPDTDDTEWLALNARAFASHPEQGRLTQRDLDDRKAEPWFDPDDFLVLRDDDRMVGFCWLKVGFDTPSAAQPEKEGTAAQPEKEGAAAQPEETGEFYAVGIDPDRQGEGLGRVLMDAGFARLAARGIRTAALYVEADNEPALALYDRYGFEQHTIDVRYRRGAVSD